MAKKFLDGNGSEHLIGKVKGAINEVAELAGIVDVVHEGFVDMGLPSGLLWAQKNLGAESDTDYGDYFSWGNTEGHAEGSGYDFSQAVYNATPAASISADLSGENDAATVILGSDFRIPTSEEFSELIENSNIQFVSGGKTNAYFIFTSKINGNTLKFPAAGVYVGTSLGNSDDIGNYISSTYNESRDTIYIASLTSLQEYQIWDRGARYYGYPIRPVSNSKRSTKIDESEKGQANGVATLDNNGKVPSLQIPDVTKNSLSVTYSQLKTLRDNAQLVPGMWYRITDYHTTTVQEDTQSADHQFDVIVRADAVNKLNENAFAAISHGDTYFTNAGAKLEAWQLKYCLDNDIDRFAWADEVNGKGVIYWMRDEWGNECPYDFKNIQFKRCKCDYLGETAIYFAIFDLYVGSDEVELTNQDDDDYQFLYTFNNIGALRIRRSDDLR